MSLTNSINRILSEPNTNYRALLEVEIDDDPLETEEQPAQASFLSTLTGEMEARVVKINRNTDQKVIVVTQDKTLLCLKRNLAKLGKREWIAPLSTVLTIITSLITANFRYALGLSSAEWRAIFIVSGFVTTGWLAYSVRKAVKAKTFHEIVSDIVCDLAAQKRYVK